jgi:hypothetical protein
MRPLPFPDFWCPVLLNSGRGGGIRTPIPGFGDRSPNRWTTPLKSETGLAVPPAKTELLHFFMRGVLAARPAKLLGLHTFGVLLFVFRRCVVAIFAIAALQRNDFPHDLDLFSRKLPLQIS